MNIWQDDRWFDLVCWSWNWFSFRDKVAGAARETVMVLWTLCFPSTRRQTHRCGRHVCHHIDWKGERRQAVIGPGVCHDSLSRHGMNVSLLLFVFSVKEPRQNLQLLYSPAQTHNSHIYSPAGKNIQCMHLQHCNKSELEPPWIIFYILIPQFSLSGKLFCLFPCKCFRINYMITNWIWRTVKTNLSVSEHWRQRSYHIFYRLPCWQCKHLPAAVLYV